VRFLLGISRGIDWLSERVGRLVAWLVLVCCLISAGNAVSRYALNASSNAWLEIQWYLFSAIFLLCAGYTLLRNEHVRIDVVAGYLPRRTQVWIDLIGTLLFLLPMAVTIGWLAWPVVEESYLRHEMSGNAGGLLRWPVKLLMPAGFALLVLQGISELIKRIAILARAIPDTSAPAGPHADPAASEPV
jgi:TRAP-type mannitol/chloroaromatic compound transport system permease small subunit